jgi:RNA polymerase sigma factor (sigma-70 family)
MRKGQEEELRRQEDELGALARDGKRDEFFAKIIPLLKPLKDYIKRRLRIAYLDMRVRTPVYTSDDILDEVILRAYEGYDRKPKNLTLEQWFYQLANQALDHYVSKRAANDVRRRSLETLTAKELSTLEEKPTVDAEGEPLPEEDLDDISYYRRDFIPPHDDQTPERILETKEELEDILRTFARLPQRDQLVFELYVREGFSAEEVGQILNIAPDEVRAIADGIRKEILAKLQPAGQRKAS